MIAAAASATDVGRPRRLIIGIGELAVSEGVDDVIVTHALGSCVAVCLHDPRTATAAMLHFLLPDSRINPERARNQPAAFADTGIALLFQKVRDAGLDPRRATVKLVGGADSVGEAPASTFMTGQRNTLAARQLLWRYSVLIAAQEVGGRVARTVHLAARDGRLQIYNGVNFKEL